MQHPNSNKELLRWLNHCSEIHSNTIDVIGCINQKTSVLNSSVTDSFNACLGHYIYQSIMNYSLCDPEEMDCRETLGDCIPTFIRCILGMPNYSLNCSSYF